MYVCVFQGRSSGSPVDRIQTAPTSGMWLKKQQSTTAAVAPPTATEHRVPAAPRNSGGISRGPSDPASSFTAMASRAPPKLLSRKQESAISMD